LQDDRHGPYVKADLERGENDVSILSIRFGKATERWELTHILIPIHSKIRLSFGYMQQAADQIVAEVQTVRELIEQVTETKFRKPVVSYETWIERSYLYIESLLDEGVNTAQLAALSWRTSLSRYVAIIRISATFFGTCDVLIDTTGTHRNSNTLGIVVINKKGVWWELIGEHLSSTLKAPLV